MTAWLGRLLCRWGPLRDFARGCYEAGWRDCEKAHEAASPLAANHDDDALGSATTLQLLREIKERGEMEGGFGRYEEEGNMLAIGAANLLDILPGSMLDYRTVDSR